MLPVDVGAVEGNGDIQLLGNTFPFRVSSTSTFGECINIIVVLIPHLLWASRWHGCKFIKFTWNLSHLLKFQKLCHSVGKAEPIGTTFASLAAFLATANFLGVARPYIADLQETTYTD